MGDIFDWSATAGNNTSIDGINCQTGMSPGNVDNLFRSVAAIVRNTFVSSWEGLFAGTTSGIPVSNGAGTISTKAAPTGDIVGTSDTQTLTNKTISGLATDLAVADGGTGASTAAQAFANIAIAESVLSSTGYIKFTNGFHILWGSGTANASTSTTISYHASADIASFSRAVVSGGGGTSVDANNPSTTACSTTGFTVANSRSESITIFYIAVGV